jgi:hypothetical protein
MTVNLLHRTSNEKWIMPTKCQQKFIRPVLALSLADFFFLSWGYFMAIFCELSRDNVEEWIETRNSMLAWGIVISSVLLVLCIFNGICFRRLKILSITIWLLSVPVLYYWLWFLTASGFDDRLPDEQFPMCLQLPYSLKFPFLLSIPFVVIYFVVAFFSNNTQQDSKVS